MALSRSKNWPIVGREQPAFLHQSGPAATHIGDGRSGPVALYPKAAKGRNGKGMECKGKGSIPKRQKGLPLGPRQDTRMLSLFQRKRPAVAAAPTPPAVSGYRRHSSEQHRGVQRPAGSRHVAADVRRQGGLARDCDQHDCRISLMSRPGRAGCTWPSWWTCSPGASWAGV